jgi:hypothetical protein
MANIKIFVISQRAENFYETSNMDRWQYGNYTHLLIMTIESILRAVT